MSNETTPDYGIQSITEIGMEDAFHMIGELMKTCPDSMFLGNILRAIGGQKVTLELGEVVTAKLIVSDLLKWKSAALRIKDKWREIKKDSRSKKRKSKCPTMSNGHCETSEDISGHARTCEDIGTPNQSNPNQTNPNQSNPTQSNPTPSTDTDVSYECVIKAAFAADTHNASRHLPSEAELAMTALQLQVTPQFLAQFLEIMRTQGYVYNNRSGNPVDVYPRNFKATLAAFWRQEQANMAEEKQREARATVPVKRADNYHPSMPGDNDDAPF